MFNKPTQQTPFFLIICNMIIDNVLNVQHLQWVLNYSLVVDDYLFGSKTFLLRYPKTSPQLCS
jgi:hypothetical protein